MTTTDIQLGTTTATISYTAVIDPPEERYLDGAPTGLWTNPRLRTDLQLTIGGKKVSRPRILSAKNVTDRSAIKSGAYAIAGHILLSQPSFEVLDRAIDRLITQTHLDNPEVAAMFIQLAGQKAELEAAEKLDEEMERQMQEMQTKNEWR